MRCVDVGDSRAFLTRKLSQLDRHIRHELPELLRVGFVLVLFDFGKAPAFVFASNSERDTTVNALQSAAKVLKDDGLPKPELEQLQELLSIARDERAAEEKLHLVRERAAAEELAQLQARIDAAWTLLTVGDIDGAAALLNPEEVPS